jgi:hypothetical protein
VFASSVRAEHLLASGSDLEDDALMRQEAMLQTLYEYATAIRTEGLATADLRCC